MLFAIGLVYWGDHGPPHFHARRAGQMVRIAIEDLSVIDGKLAPGALALVLEWASLHQRELREAWRKASNYETPDPIDPLE